MKLVGDWGKAVARLRDMRGRFLPQAATELGRVAELLVERVKTGLRSQAPGGQRFAPLHPFTIAQKGSSIALAGGDLEKAITYRVHNGGLVADIGVFSDSGMGLVARVHEWGITIPVTPAMRGYLSAEGLHLRLSTTHVTIPARPFFRPIFEQARVLLRNGEVTALRFVMRGQR